MNEMNDIVKVAVDAYHGNTAKYSTKDSMELLQKALIELNNGSTKLDYKAIRDGKCSGLFAVVEEILARTVIDGLSNDEFFMNMVDFRNVAMGDKQDFDIENSDLFVVSEAADGTQGIRRQRIQSMTSVVVPTSFKVVKIYDELNRVLSGQVDFNAMIRRVGESFRQQLLNDVYGVWEAATANEIGGAAYFPTAGTSDEEAMLELVSHVEAAAGGRPATIIGTKAALRNLAPYQQGADSQSDLYNLGYYGKFYGTNMVAVPQRHKIGTTQFVYDDKMITVLAGDPKPLKCVYEGDPTIILGNPLDRKDLTQEYLYGEKYGIALAVASNTGIGRYELA